MTLARRARARSDGGAEIVRRFIATLDAGTRERPVTTP